MPAYLRLQHVFVLYYLKDMLQLMLSPLKGWEDVSYDGFDAHRIFSKGFIPLILFCALTVFCRWFYHDDASLPVLFQQAIICFLKYFAGYYIAVFCFSLYLPICIDGEISANKSSTFILYGLSLLAFVNILQNCAPLDIAVLYLIPLYVFYILWRGIRYLSVSFSGVTTFLCLCLFSICAPPYIIQFLFNLVVSEY